MLDKCEKVNYNKRESAREQLYQQYLTKTLVDYHKVFLLKIINV